MGATQPNREQIFITAAEIQDANERAAYLENACGNDQRLRAEILELLEHDRAADSLLDKSVPGLRPTIDQPIAEKPGTVIGPYKLLQQIGQGGMGVVYMVEQKEPVERRVALKIIKPGMDTQQVIGRFEAERQALAVMDHQNIAKVFEAGATDTGRPYFVMELVRGIPITQYCDEHHLSPRERLELFVPVCQAVQHAHQKGIIHRDIKPSTKVSGSEALASIAANRKIDPGKLSLLVRGELDWIVMKALEKDRGRRYATATSFAEDIQHYLNDEAVVACPPSARYRFRKFVRRNRPLIATVALVTAALVLGLSGPRRSRRRAGAFGEILRSVRATGSRISRRVEISLLSCRQPQQFG